MIAFACSNLNICIMAVKMRFRAYAELIIKKHHHFIITKELHTLYCETNIYVR